MATDAEEIKERSLSIDTTNAPHCIASGPDDEPEQPLSVIPTYPADVEDLKDGLVLAEDLKDALGALRERAKGLKRFYQRLADAERASVRVLHKTIAKDGRRAPSLGAAVWSQDKEVKSLGRMGQLPSRLRALWEQRASQMESMAGVWDSQQQRWTTHAAAVHDSRRKVEDDTRPLAKELCAARADTDRLQRKHQICRQTAVQALRARGSMEGATSDFATACKVGKPDKEFQKAVIRGDSSFRDYVLTKHELSRQAAVLHLAEEQHRAQIMKVHSLAKEEHLAFFRELKESLQLAISSLNVFCGTMLDVHSELGDHNALMAGSPGADDDDDVGFSLSPTEDRGIFPTRSSSPKPTSLRSKVFRFTAAARENTESPTSEPQEPPVALWSSENTGTANADRRGSQSAKEHTEEMAQTLLTNLDADRSSLKVLHSLLLGFRDAEDAALKSLTVAQLPTPGLAEPVWIEEAISSLKSFVQLRIEAAGAMSTLLVEQLLPAVETFLSEYKEDILLLQEEQRRMETSLSQKSQKQKLMEVPIHFANEDSELIFQTRLVRIADEVKQRMRQRFTASASMLDQLLLAERSRLHIRISDVAPQALGRLAAKSTATDTRLPLWWSHNMNTSSTAHVLWGGAGDDQAKADDQLLAEEGARVKALARAVTDFSGKDGFSFRAGDQVKIVLQVGDTWRGIDPQGNKGEFPSHYVEVGEQSTLHKLSLADLVSLFKKDVLENDAYVPSAEDEEYSSRFSEYLGEASGPALRVLASFSCALLSRRKVAIAALQKVLDTRHQMPANLLDTVPLQGRLYVTAHWMGFFSHFSTTSLQDSTTVLFRISEMQGLEKRTNALIFQNSIEVSLSDGTSYCFSSFQHRDSAYEYLVNLRLVSRSVQSELPSAEESATVAKEDGEQSQETKRVVVLPATSCAPYPPPPPGSHGPASPLKHELPGRIFGVHVESLFDAVFREFGPGSVQAEYQAANSSKLAPGQTESPSWSPSPPPGEASIPPEASEAIPRRQVRWLRPVTAAAWMRRMAKVPEWMECDEAMAVYGLGKGKGFVVTLDVELAGMPYVDYFVLKVRYKAVAVGVNRTQVDAEVELDWRKSTLLQSRIEQTSIEEVQNTFDGKLLPLISKRLAQVESHSHEVPRTPSADQSHQTSTEAAVAALQKRAADAVGTKIPAGSVILSHCRHLGQQLLLFLKMVWGIVFGLIPQLGSSATGWSSQVWLLLLACGLLLFILRSLLRIEAALKGLLARERGMQGCAIA